MTHETSQPTAVELHMVVQRACQVEGCPHFRTLDCPDHTRREDLGVAAKSGGPPAHRAES